MKKLNFKNFKEQKGITLVALVVTIVVLLILAGVTITYVFSDNGILSQAQSAANKTDVATVLEEIQSRLLAIQLGNTDTWTYSNTDVIEVIEEVAGVTVDEWDDDFTTENGNTVTISSLWVGEKVYDKTKGVNVPKLTSEMTPIVYDSTANDSAGGWVKTTADDDEWYSYTTTDKQWANVVIDGEFDENGVLNEDATGYTMWVWIPRYAYQIASGYHTSSAGTINIKFMVGTTDVAADGYTEWDNASGEGNWNIHPAFEYGETVTGLWVAKFEASNTECTTDVSTGQTGETDLTLQVKAGVTSWRKITIGDMYTICLDYNTSLNSHMMKNDEWGAVAYLAQSEYGKNDEISINSSNSFITGTGGVSASSTGNVYGIYDLSGGALEYVAAYVANDNIALSTYGSTLSSGAKKGTTNVYNVSDVSDSSPNNYSFNSGVYGDAVYETSAGVMTGVTGTGLGWYTNFPDFPYVQIPFFSRGGAYYYGSAAGVFFSQGGSGKNETTFSFRPVLAVS